MNEISKKKIIICHFITFAAEYSANGRTQRKFDWFSKLEIIIHFCHQCMNFADLSEDLTW